MFKKDKSTNMATNTEHVDPRTHNQIVKGTTIIGEIESDGVIRFDGVLKGNLTTAGKLVVGPSGSIFGDVKCKNADIEGSIEGKIIVAELLTLKASSKLKGEIVTQKLAVETGASLNGTCNMGQERTTPSQTQTPLQKDGKKQGK